MKDKYFKICGVRYNLDHVSSYWAEGNMIHIQTINHIDENYDAHRVDVVDKYLITLDSITNCVDVENVNILGRTEIS